MEEEKKGAHEEEKEELGYSYAMLEVLKFLNIKKQHQMQRVSQFMRELVTLKLEKSFNKL